MMRMKKRNLRNIRCIFEEKAGVDLNPKHRQPYFSQRKLWVLAAAVVVCLALAAFSVPLFSSLDGDELSLAGSYEGNGIVSVRVENRSGKPLSFQKSVKLMRWVTAEEVPRLGGKAVFQNTAFEPHSSGVMTIDLSAAYDMEALENLPNGEWYYLLLTNNNYLFGQDWMCSIRFAPEEPEIAETVPSIPAEPEIRQNIRQELQFYFEESYTGELMAFNGPNFQYQQKVDELLSRFDGTIVPSLSPMIMVGSPSVFLAPEPMMGKPPEGTVFDESIPADRQYLLSVSDWSYTDGFGRMVATASEKAWVQTATIPQRKGETDGGVAMPLVFLFVYDAKQAVPENYAFLYGQILSFGELEPYKVLEDEHYAVYDATDLIYRDVDVWLDQFLTTREDLYCDEQIRQRVHAIYDFYRNSENIQAMYGYLEFPD